MLSIYISHNLMAESIISGRQGPKGDTGAQGPQGATGSRGPTGPSGPSSVTVSLRDVSTSPYTLASDEVGFVVTGSPSSSLHAYGPGTTWTKNPSYGYPLSVVKISTS